MHKVVLRLPDSWSNFLVFYKQISLKEGVLWQKMFPNIIKLSRLSHKVIFFSALPGEGILPYISYIGMWRTIG